MTMQAPPEEGKAAKRTDQILDALIREQKLRIAQLTDIELALRVEFSIQPTDSRVTAALARIQEFKNGSA